MTDSPPTPEKPTQPGGVQPDPSLRKPPPTGTYYPPAPPYNPYARQPTQRLSGLALAGFIVALASPLFYFLIVPAPVGLVLSIIGLVRDVNGRGMRGRGFAIAGIAVSSAVILLALLLFAALIAYRLRS